MENKIIYWLLALITIAGLMVRIRNITTNPPELFSDEIRGYISAKNIIETGKDINGKFGLYFYNRLEYYPPVYGYLTYLTSLVVKNNILAIRFPAVVSGTLAIVSIHFLAELLFKKKEISIFSAFFLAFLPWSIHFSRIGWEPSLLILSLILPIIFFKLFINKNKRILFFVSCFLFGFGIYTYRSLEFLAPLFLSVLIILYWKSFKHKLKTLFLGIFIFGILTIPCLYTSITQPLMHERAIRISTFKDGVNLSSTRTFIKNYFAHFNPKFLFISGDPNLRQNAGNGELYWITLPLIIIGVFYLIKNFSKAESKLLLIWLLIYPLGGSLTNDGVPHATRTLIGAPLFAMLTAIGLFFVIKALPRFSKLIVSVIVIVLFLEFSKFCHVYFDLYPQKSLTWWGYGQKQIFDYVANNENIFDTVCLDNLNYWNEETLTKYYLPKTTLEIISGITDGKCQNKNSLIVTSTYKKPDKLWILKNTILDLKERPYWTIYSIR